LTYCLPFEAVVEINRKFTGVGAVLDRGAIESALARPLQGGFGIEEFYPTVMEKAAVLLHGIATSHGFVDGNKRTGWVCCVTFLALHGLTLHAEVDDYADDFVVDVVVGEISHEDSVLWLLERLQG
jgi:death-on-curing protein